MAILGGAGVEVAAVRSGSRTHAGVRARKLCWQVAVSGRGGSSAAVARSLGVSTSAVNRLAVVPEPREMRNYLNAL